MASQSDIAVGQWNLVYERASEAIAKLLLLFFFVILLVVRPLRSFIESINHETVLLCLAQEKASKPTPLAAPISTTPAISTAPKTPVTIPIPTPAFKKKSFIRPIISLNSLKIVPVPKPSLQLEPTITIAFITPIPISIPTPTPASKKKSR